MPPGIHRLKHVEFVVLMREHSLERFGCGEHIPEAILDLLPGAIKR
jgi:hypothetical protein